MSGIFDHVGTPNDAGGPLTEDDFLNAVRATARQTARLHPPLLTSMRTIERGRYGARVAEASAGYAEDELIATSRWRWLRRRVLRRHIGKRSRNAESLRATFGWEPA